MATAPKVAAPTPAGGLPLREVLALANRTPCLHARQSTDRPGDARSTLVLTCSTEQHSSRRLRECCECSGFQPAGEDQQEALAKALSAERDGRSSSGRWDESRQLMHQIRCRCGYALAAHVPPLLRRPAACTACITSDVALALPDTAHPAGGVPALLCLDGSSVVATCPKALVACGVRSDDAATDGGATGAATASGA